jgi:hypothetical protein
VVSRLKGSDSASVGSAPAEQRRTLDLQHAAALPTRARVAALHFHSNPHDCIT